jgi:hypothetical protein
MKIALLLLFILNSSFRLFNPDYSTEHHSEKILVSYTPIGFRIKPNKEEFMLKFNLDPLWDYSAPNIFYYDKVQLWAGLVIGYSSE